jgi:hypothetical protein
VSDNENLKENETNVNINFEKDMQMQKIKEEVLKKFEEYKKTMNYLAADAPIEILCLPKSIEKILLDQGFFRVYDLFDLDFVKVKGLGDVRCRQLTACLDKFFSML